MQTLEDQTSILSALNAIRLASLGFWNWIARLALDGASALLAVTAGTTSLRHELRAAVAISAPISRGPAEVDEAVIAGTLGARVGRLARRGRRHRDRAARRTRHLADGENGSMRHVSEPAYPSLGMGRAARARYPEAWRPSIARESGRLCHREGSHGSDIRRHSKSVAT
jgi:hypothetical protein